MKFQEVLSEPIRSGISRPRDSRGSGIPLINMRELFANDYISDCEAELVEVNAADLDRFMLAEGDLLFARQSLTFAGAGKVSYVGGSQEKRVFESHILRARPNKAKVDARYLFYFFSRGPGRRGVESIIQQVAAAGIRSSELSSLPIFIPGLPEQRAIAEVLGALDDKILANRRVLESSGLMLRAAYDRLPSSATATLEDIAINVREQKDAKAIDPDGTYIGLEHIDSRSLWLERAGIGVNAASAKSVFKIGDTLFGRLRPYFRKVAYPGVEGVCSTDILVLRPKSADATWVLALCASSDEAVSRAVQNSNGTKMPRAKWEDIAPVPVPDLDSGATQQFSQTANGIAERCLAAVVENKRLATTRDELLPLLMYGRITIKDAEKRVEEEV